MSKLFKGVVNLRPGVSTYDQALELFTVPEEHHAVMSNVSMELAEFGANIDGRLTYTVAEGEEPVTLTQSMPIWPMTVVAMWECLHEKYGDTNKVELSPDNGPHVIRFESGVAPTAVFPTDELFEEDPVIIALLSNIYQSINASPAAKQEPQHYAIFRKTGVEWFLRTKDGHKTFYRNIFSLDTNIIANMLDQAFHFVDGIPKRLPGGIPPETPLMLSDDERGKHIYRTNIGLISQNINERHKHELFWIVEDGPIEAKVLPALILGELERMMLVTRTIFSGEEGWVSALQAGADVYKFLNGGSDSLERAMSHRRLALAAGEYKGEAVETLFPTITVMPEIDNGHPNQGPDDAK